MNLYFLLKKLRYGSFFLILLVFIFQLLENFPSNNHLRLIGQMEVAVSRVAQNIEEAKGRQYKKEFIQFLYIALQKDRFLKF